MTSKTQDAIAGTKSVRIRSKGVRRRVRDRLKLSKVLKITKGESGTSKKLPELTILFGNAETVNSILMNYAPSHTANTSKKSGVANRNVHLDCGAPAEHLTVEVMLARRRKKEEKARAADGQKIKRCAAVEADRKRLDNEKEEYC